MPAEAAPRGGRIAATFHGKVPNWSEFVLADSPSPPQFQARFWPHPDRPCPPSQSFSRSYGSNLPTSLTYIVLDTRGCSPWRPAADIGYGRPRKLHCLPRIFKGRRRCTGHRKSRGALRKQRPYLRTSRFQGVRSLQRKENSSRDQRQHLRVRLRYRTGTHRSELNLRVPVREY